MSEETFGNWIKIMNKTLNYYNENAQSFASGTVSVEFTEMQDKFLQKLNPGAYILDFGCGAGRDTKYFLDQGYLVEAIDGSEQLCQIASKHTGIKVRQMLFQELKVNEGERNGRYFTDFTIDTFADFVQEIHNLQIEEHWITGDVRSGRGEEKWLNLIMQKK